MWLKFGAICHWPFCSCPSFLLHAMFCEINHYNNLSSPLILVNTEHPVERWTLNAEHRTNPADRRRRYAETPCWSCSPWRLSKTPNHTGRMLRNIRLLSRPAGTYLFTSGPAAYRLRLHVGCIWLRWCPSVSCLVFSSSPVKVAWMMKGGGEGGMGGRKFEGPSPDVSQTLGSRFVLDA